MGEKDNEENIWKNKGERTVRIKTNLELMTKYKPQDIVTVIKIGRLEWIGQVIRMNESKGDV
jgi:hypothetical protein